MVLVFFITLHNNDEFISRVLGLGCAFTEFFYRFFFNLGLVIGSPRRVVTEFYRVILDSDFLVLLIWQRFLRGVL